MYFCEKFNITYMKYREIYTLAVFLFHHIAVYQ